MKSFSTYHVNKPTTVNGYSITISTTLYGTEEEIEYMRKNCEETIGSGLAQEYGSPFTSQGHILKDEFKTNGKVVPDILGGWRYEE